MKIGQKPNKDAALRPVACDFGSVKSAPPNGYSILMVAPGLAINESLRSKLPYDAEKSFAPVSLLVAAPMVLAVHSSLAVNNVKELIAYPIRTFARAGARRRPTAFRRTT